MRVLTYCFYLFLLFIIKSCASMSSITGGIKDTIKPVLTDSSPKHQSTHVKGNQIVLEFDELIDVKNLKKNLVIVPNIENEYTYEVVKNMVFINFSKPFKDSTTYVMDFGESIVDVRESNIAENVKIAFSTTFFIDSLFVSGEVRDLMSRNTVGKANIAIYEANDTLDVDQDRPLYFTKADSLGYFKVSNMRAGNYKVYALIEGKKADLIYNAPDETIGFLADTLKLKDFGSPSNTIYLSQYDLKQFKFQSARPRRQYFEIAANKTIFDYQIKFDSAFDKKIAYHKDKDLIRFFKPEDFADSVKVSVSLSDSIKNTVDSTFFVKFDAKANSKKTLPFAFNVLPASGSDFVKNDSVEIRFQFNKPMISYAVDSLSYKFDKDTLYNYFDSADFYWDKNDTELRCKKKFVFNENMELNIKKNMFISLENDTSKASKVEYKIKKEEDYGTMTGVVQTEVESFLMQIINDKGVIEREFKNPKTFVAKYLTIGEKQVKILIDENLNGKWDSSDFKTRRSAEPIHIFKIENKLRAGWVMEDVLISFEKDDIK
ncbi:MAG: hypothetical protein EAZ97_10710 [Bacteroidetes bacterium]|nr:MAG: hypothetical protein EAZ97_10710 [Bacteroidota bacterium]